MSDMIRVDVDHMSWRSKMPVCAAVRSGDVVFVSGQVGCDATGAVISPGDVTAQAHQVFEGLAQVLAAAGGSLEDIVDLVSFHSDPREIEAAFEVGRGYLPEGAYPGWTPIGVLGSYSSEIRLVVRAIACLGDSRKQCVPMVNAAEDARLPVSAACLKNDLVFATDFTAGEVREDERGAPEAQTRGAHQRIATALAALGGSLDDILDIISFHQDPRTMVAGETAHLETFADTALDQAPAWTAIGTPALYGFGRLCQYRIIADLHEGPRIAQTPEGLHWKHQPISGGTRKTGGRLIGIAGEVSSDGEGNIIAPGDTGGQARYAFDRIQEVVEMHGGSLDDVVEVTAFHKDVRAWQIVVEVARELEFDPATIDQIALVVTELGTNLVKHAGGGRLTLHLHDYAHPPMLEIEAADEGPGIADPEWALTDGCSSGGGLGLGLGTVNRLMDQLEITSPLGQSGGARIVCRRRLPQQARDEHRPADVGVATRPRIGEDYNGDAFVVLQSQRDALVGVIDGIGHGTLAHAAAQAARRYVESHQQQTLVDLFAGVNELCRTTRGAVMALANIQFDRGCLTFAGVGNVEARLLNRQDRSRLVARRGVLGMQAVQPLIKQERWDEGSVLIVHSDGLPTRWDWDSIVDLLPERSSVVAEQLLKRLARLDDDATVLVVKGGIHSAR